MSTSDLLEIEFHEDDDGNITIRWDEEDPKAIAAGINDWTEQDWLEFLTDACQDEAEDLD